MKMPHKTYIKLQWTVIIMWFVIMLSSCAPYLEISAGYAYPINDAERFGIPEEGIAGHAAIGNDFTDKLFCELRHRSMLNRSPEIQLYDLICGFKIGGRK